MQVLDGAGKKVLFLMFFFLSGVGLIQMEVSGSCVLSLLSLSFKKLIAMHAMRRGKGEEIYDSKKKKSNNELSLNEPKVYLLIHMKISCSEEVHTRD